MTRFGCDFGRFWPPKWDPKSRDGTEGFFVKKSFGFDMMLCIASRGSKSRPRGPKTSPRASQEAPKSAPGAPKRPQEASKPTQERPKRPQEAPKTAPTSRKKATKMFEIAEIAGIDETQRPCPKSQNEKGGRAAVMPLGASQSAARPGGAEHGVPDRNHKSQTS